MLHRYRLTARSLPMSLATLLVATSLLVLTAPAAAQDRFDVETLNPLPTQRGNGLSVSSHQTLDPGHAELQLFTGYLHRPLVFTSASSGEQGTLLDGQLRMNLMGAIGITRFFDLGVAMPIVHSMAGTPVVGFRQITLTENTTALGDIRIIPRLRLLQIGDDSEWHFGLGALADVFIPTGSEVAFASEGFRVAPRLSLSLTAPSRLAFLLNAGYLVREQRALGDRVIDDEISLGGAILIPLMTRTTQLTLVTEVTGALDVMNHELSGTQRMETQAALRFEHYSLTAQVGGGAGVLGDIPNPDWRIFASLGVSLPIERAEIAPVPEPPVETPIVTPPVDPPEPVTPEPPVETPVEAPTAPEQIETRIAFEFNETELDATARRQLDEVAMLLNTWPELQLINVEGHSDDQGRPGAKQRISQQRADNVREHLISRGIAPERLRAVGISDAAPIADNETEAGRAQNRRVDFHIIIRSDSR